MIDGLGRHSLIIDAAEAADLINDRVDAIAAALQIGTAAARRYLDDAAIDDLADNLADTLADELPGVDLLSQPRDVMLDPPTLGLTIERLAEATLLQLSDGSSQSGLERVRVLAQHIAMLGSMLSESAGDSTPVPHALIARAASQLERAAAHPRISPDLAAAFSQHARQLRDLTAPTDETDLAPVIDITTDPRPPRR